ncbi:MAG: pyrroline-5-carboxylate reductase [Gammaproteobacteria bacterium]|nr:pyrroline-5-carboxylate reductase [Gammaproteobacteria bacterium]
MSDTTICFIGGGNMATSLIGGLIASGRPAADITVAEPEAGRRQALNERFGVHAVADNTAVAADAMVLAVKPQVLGAVCRQIGPGLAERAPLFISIAAGIRVDSIARWLGFDAAIIRAMPNTPALLGCGASGLFANRHVTSAQQDQGESILRAVGLTQWVTEESQMDAVTAVSGSGPAYFLMLMEAMAEAGVDMGLPPATARLLVMETAFGAAKMAMESDETPAELRARVTSPGGTTEAAIRHFEEGGLRRLVGEALERARARAVTLADEQGAD